ATGGLAGETDIVSLTGVGSLSEMSLTRRGDDLLIVVTATGDTLEIKKFFSGDRYQLQFADGNTADAAFIMALPDLVLDDTSSTAPLPTTDNEINGTCAGETIYGTNGSDL